MNNLKFTGISIITGILVGTIGVYLYYKKQTPVDIPNLSPRSGDATASTEFLNAQRSVGFYRDAIRKSPHLVKNYVELAQIYLQEARVTALHHEYFPKAELLLDKALELDPNDFNALITKASMLATLHQFEQAKLFAQNAIKLNPYNAFAYGVLCDAHVELGEYAEAVKTCDKMLSIRPDLRSYARASYLRELHGDNDGAKKAMQMAGDAGVFGQENRAWAFYTLGKLYLNEGKLDTAEYIFNGILQERPNYAFAMNGLAQVKCAEQKYSEAIQFLKNAWQATPEHSFLEELANVYKATGQTVLAEETIETVMTEFSDHTKEGWNVDKEFALFCANQDIHLEEALERAQREYTRRPNNIEALDTYAWTLFKNGKALEAVPFVEKAMRLGTNNATMKYHAGMIYNAAGNKVKARESLQAAFHVNPYITVLHLNDAQKTLAALNDIASAE